jgi:PAS domain S-box-containing protein
MKSRTSGHAVKSRGVHGRRSLGRQVKPLHASELRFRRLFETAQDGILILNGSTYKILEANPCLSRMLGRKRRELIGKSVSELGMLADPLGFQHVLEKLEPGKSARFDNALHIPGKPAVAELEFLCNSYDERGHLLIQCNVRDVGKRRQAERKLRTALQQLAKTKRSLEARVLERTADLQQKNAELEAFSYSLSHDLRAPIRAIVSFTQLAMEEYGKTVGPPATEFLKKAIGAAQRLDRLILDVLAFSKSTRQRLLAEDVNLDELLKDILQERPEWAAPNAEIKIETPLSAVHGDRASMTQCLTNLLDNAIKFVPSGNRARVRVYTRPAGDRVRLYIEDNGIGIPESAQPRIFDLFQRAHNGYEGHGIGLAIVRRAAERMGGRVGLSSTPGHGSRFWLELPKANGSV